MLSPQPLRLREEPNEELELVQAAGFRTRRCGAEDEGEVVEEARLSLMPRHAVVRAGRGATPEQPSWKAISSPTRSVMNSPSLRTVVLERGLSGCNLRENERWNAVHERLSNKADRYYARVNQLTSQAERAGLRVGDLVVKVDGKDMEYKRLEDVQDQIDQATWPLVLIVFTTHLIVSNTPSWQGIDDEAELVMEMTDHTESHGLAGSHSGVASRHLTTAVAGQVRTHADGIGFEAWKTWIMRNYICAQLAQARNSDECHRLSRAFARWGWRLMESAATCAHSTAGIQAESLMPYRIWHEWVQTWHRSVEFDCLAAASPITGRTSTKQQRSTHGMSLCNELRQRNCEPESFRRMQYVICQMEL